MDIANKYDWEAAHNEWVVEERMIALKGNLKAQYLATEKEIKYIKQSGLKLINKGAVLSAHQNWDEAKKAEKHMNALRAYHKNSIRPDARILHLARGFCMGKSYHQVEQSTKPEKALNIKDCLMMHRIIYQAATPEYVHDNPFLLADIVLWVGTFGVELHHDTSS